VRARELVAAQIHTTTSKPATNSEIPYSMQFFSLLFQKRSLTLHYSVAVVAYFYFFIHQNE
jgi:hypothetical protein